MTSLSCHACGHYAHLGRCRDCIGAYPCTVISDEYIATLTRWKPDKLPPAPDPKPREDVEAPKAEILNEGYAAGARQRVPTSAIEGLSKFLAILVILWAAFAMVYCAAALFGGLFQ